MARRLTRPSVFAAECPSRENLCLLSNKWSLLILRALRGKSLRFTDLHRHVGGISQKMLAQTLRVLEVRGLVDRRVYPEIPIRIEYSLTRLSRPLVGPIDKICRWAESAGAENSRRK